MEGIILQKHVTDLELLSRIKENYIPTATTLRELARLCGSTHPRVKRIMDKNNIEFIKGKKILSESHKAKIIKSLKPGAWNKGLKMKREFRINSIIQNHRFATFDFINSFENLEKVLLLHKLLNTPTARVFITKEWYFDYMNRFYGCSKFNAIYEKWIDSGFDSKLKPSLDHKTPLSKGGTWDIENLDMKTWFENRVKSDMTESEWLLIKNDVNLYFS